MSPIVAPPDDAPWYDNHANLALLCRYLVECHDHDRYDVLHVLAEPWKWEAEFKEAETRRLVQFS